MAETISPRFSDSGDQIARVCMISQRNIRKHAAWCSMYEFEDVVYETDSVHQIDLARGSGFPWRSKLVGSLAWRHIPFSARLNPGLREITVDGTYDIFFFPCINPWDLLYLNCIKGWKDQCRTKVCYIYEEWPGDVPGHDHLLKLLNDFDHVVLGWASSAVAVQKMVRVPCHHLSPAADTIRFSPYPEPPIRSIDIFSLGRRVEHMHKQLLKTAGDLGLFYIYDTLPGQHIQPDNHVEHRELFANIAKRSKYFITYPAKVDRFEETRGLSEPGTRFYEGVASGAVMVGQAPESPTFKREFGWSDSVIDIGEDINSLLDVFGRFSRAPFEYDLISKRNAAEALKRHDWMHRWEAILGILGASITPKL
ncbi:MAG TPA: glycosyltransferase, partial [Verrucomicrobiae bacterium]|nr:glycosyltransferase [Verrucomicrobiae bacterium]